MQEKIIKLRSGALMLVMSLLTPIVLVSLIVAFTQLLAGTKDALRGPFILLEIGGWITWILMLSGFIVVSPNQGKVLQLFGTYVGTIRETGFYWGNPFYLPTKVSLRLQTFETGQVTTPETKDPATGKVLTPGSTHRQTTKVNDKEGTPIEIAAIVVWRVVNTAEAVFSVDKYDEYVHMQAESALRNMASNYCYDDHHGDEFTLRGNTEQVAQRLAHEVNERTSKAGVEIIEARISYLAYASEIAAAMLQRQQATAIVAARQKIVEGAVGMVEMALEMLAKKNMVVLDDERKAAMVSNLLVVLCGDRNAQPVVNTGSIYS
jgi:regulator of protease activity HflC (stomatin/prohibitin superfamily)